MRILWSSNALWANTGYGVQAKHLLPRLRALGHDVAQFAWYGLQGSCIEADGIRIYPGLHDPWGLDIIQGHIKHHDADLLVSLQDIWVLPDNYADMIHEVGAKFAPWFPVDHDPIQQLVVDRAATSDYPLVYSQHGARAAEAAGLEARYMPLGISDEYLNATITKAEARDKLEWPQDAYVLTMVAANKSMPSRKSFPEVLQAFKQFRARHEEALLYVHTHTNASGGVDFEKILKRLELPEDSVRFPNQYLNAIGALGEDYLAAVYRASDCHLSPSHAEGFGLPIVEAQACGTPVITTKWVSMPELTWNGLMVKPMQLEWTPMNSWNAVPGVDDILWAMESIYRWSPDYRQHHGARGQQAASHYSWDVIVRDYWAPFLEEVEEEIRGEDARDSGN